MGEANNALNVYMDRADRIKSVLEYYLKEKLPVDWVFEAADGFYSVRNSKGKLSFRQRDIIGNARGWGTSFRLGIENQDSINLTYPWRVMEMDTLAYGRKIEEIQERNEGNKESYGKRTIFKYRYKKGNRLTLVLNITLYWGRKGWKEPASLQDMMCGMEALPEKMRRLAGEYKVNIIHMRQISEKDIKEMDSDLKYVLGIMKRTGSRKKYEEYIQENSEYFSRIPKSAVDVIDVCTNIKDIMSHLRFKANKENGEEEGDMCKALADIKKEAEKQGIRKGVKQGIGQGVKQGIDRANKLVRLLLADGRQEDLMRSTEDARYRQKLFQEYQI